MFIDQYGNLQFDSIEEAKENKELVVKEFKDWEIPSVEEIELSIINSIKESIDSFEALGILETVIGDDPNGFIDQLNSNMKDAFNIGSKIIDEIGDEIGCRKYNDYINRAMIAFDNIKSQLRV